MYASFSDSSTGNNGRGRVNSVEGRDGPTRGHSPSKYKGTTRKYGNLPSIAIGVSVSGALLFFILLFGPSSKDSSKMADDEGDLGPAFAHKLLLTRTLSDHNSSMSNSSALEDSHNMTIDADHLKESLEKEFRSSLKKAKREKKRKEHDAERLRAMFPDGHLPDIPNADPEVAHHLEEHMQGHYPEYPVLEMEEQRKQAGSQV